MTNGNTLRVIADDLVQTETSLPTPCDKWKTLRVIDYIYKHRMKSGDGCRLRTCYGGYDQKFIGLNDYTRFEIHPKSRIQIVV